MKVWKVKDSRQQEICVNESIITFAWDLEKSPWGGGSNLKQFKTSDDLFNELLRKRNLSTITEWIYADNYMHVNDILNLLYKIEIGDIVVIPSRSVIHMGEVSGEYKFGKIGNTILHYRSVKWLNQIPNSIFNARFNIKFKGYFLSFFTFSPVTSEYESRKFQDLIKERNFKTEIDE